VTYRKKFRKRQLRLRLISLIVDLVAILATLFSTTLTTILLFDVTHLRFMGQGAVLVILLAIPTWLIFLSFVFFTDTYALFSGLDFYESALKSTFFSFSFVSLVGFIFELDAARSFVLIGLPLGCLFTLLLRWMLRQTIIAVRRRFQDQFPVDVVLEVRGGEASQGLSLDGTEHLKLVGHTSSNDEREITQLAVSNMASFVLLRSSNALTTERTVRLGWLLESEGIGLLVEPHGGSILRPGRSSLIPHPSTTLLRVRTIHLTAPQRIAKRGFDIALSLVLTIAFSPFVLLGALVILLSEGRPAFFRQRRVGRSGRVFQIVKLRTMRNSSTPYTGTVDHYDGPFSKNPNDPRVTKVGRFLRRWSIDELPQLLSVLTGKMSLVGPRPRMEHEVSDSPMSHRRLEARPGITGIWQVSGRSHIPLDQAEMLDVEYVDGWSLTSDLAIILRTIRVVIRHEGAF
jgi:lipopolysaccharide/colanic/teichoic acid biosynthesis glycosyltransferase